MSNQVKIVAGLLVLFIVGCTGPKPPPGWPSGDERPINPSYLTKAPK